MHYQNKQLYSIKIYTKQCQIFATKSAISLSNQQLTTPTFQRKMHIENLKPTVKRCIRRKREHLRVVFAFQRRVYPNCSHLTRAVMYLLLKQLKRRIIVNFDMNILAKITGLNGDSDYAGHYNIIV